jgi:hypothetical protein
MIDVKQAVSAAIIFANDLFSDEVARISLEEVYLSDDQKEWRVTLGLTDRADVVDAALGKTPSKRFKVFSVGSLTGDVRSMRVQPF